MDSVLQIVVLGRSARNGAVIKNRQPLSKMFVKCDLDLEDLYADIIKDELNIKSVEFTTDMGGFVSYQFKPQLKTVGPKFGRQLNDIRSYLSEMDGNVAKKELDQNGKLVLPLASGQISLLEEDLLIETTQTEGFYTVTDRGITVAIDTNLTTELIEEGFIREIVSKIQTMRKEAGFNVTDHITVTMQGSNKVTDIALRKADDISSDTLADSVSDAQPDGFVKEWDINGENIIIGVKKV